jgi:uncharacterized protein DUF397
MVLFGPEELDELPWKKASYCNGGACIQVAQLDGLIFLGDSKNPSGPILSANPLQWNSLIGKIKRGEFDGL